MNRKFINGLLLLAVTTAGCGTFTSCKDTDDDLKAEVAKSNADLQTKLDELSSTVAQLKDAQDACKTECAGKIADLLSKILKVEGDYKDADVTLNSKIQTVSDKLTVELARLIAEISRVEGEIPTETEIINLIKTTVRNEFGVDYYKNLGLLTKDDIAGIVADDLGYASIDDLKADLASIASLAAEVANLKNTILNSQELTDKINAEIQRALDGLPTILTEDQIRDLIRAEIVNVNTLIENVKTLFQTEVSRLDGRIDGYKNRLEILENTSGQQANEITELKNAIANLNLRVDGLQSSLDKITVLEAKVETLSNEIVLLETKLEGFGSKLDNVDAKAEAAYAEALKAYNFAQDNFLKLTILESLIGDCTGLQDLATEVRNLKNDYATLKSNLEAKDTELEKKLEDLDLKVERYNTALTQDVKKLTQRVAANEKAIKTLQEQVNKLLKLEDRLNALITNILVQGTYNPLFGTFSLPIGVQSNMLVNYYGQNVKQSYDFPSYTYAPVFNDEPTITEAEAAILAACGMTPQRIENGELLMDGSLGRVFVTINPNNVNFDGKTLELVNSQDKASTVKLTNLRKSDEELTFGYSARSANNGFYQATAMLEKDINAVAGAAVHIDANLKSAMKEILQDKRNNLRSNVIALMKAVYDQVNGMLPAYGLKAGWSVDGKDYAVYSNYNIAATTFKPLSFAFLYGQSSPSKLPIIDPITNAIFNLDPEDYKFDFSDITFQIDTKDVTLNFTIAPVTLTYDGTLTANIKGEVIGTGEFAGQVIGTVDATGEVSKKDMDKFLKEIENQFNQKIGTWNTTIKEAFDEAISKMITNVDAAVQKLLVDMQGKINDKIAGMITDIEDEVNGKVGSYIGRFNNLITRYNNIAKRLNNVLEDPNHYLQPTMFYKAGNGGDYFLSNNPERPTEFVKDGGEGFIAYATTYTAEVAAPSYRKLVAVANVIDNATGATAADAQAQCVKINGDAKFLAEVVPGYQKRFVIPTKNMKPGYTYEILYTAVDYQGATSTSRFYLTVK